MDLAGEPQSLGPERPTLAERFVKLFPLPYAAACLLVTILVGPPLQFLVIYLGTFDLAKTIAIVVTSVYTTTSFQIGTIPVWQGVTSQVIWSTTVFALLYMTRFMRRKIANSEVELQSISPQGEAALHRAFGRISRTPMVLPIAAAFFSLSILPLYDQMQAYASLPAVGWSVASNLVVSLIFATFIWVYFRSLWGLHLLGKESLRLKPHYEDPMLGVRPVGSITLSLFFALFLVGGLSTLSLVMSQDVVGIVILFALVSFGTLMFFLPLLSIHERMVQEKRSQQKLVLGRFSELTTASSKSESHLEKKIDRLTELLTFQALKDQITTLPTWPLDIGILSRFLAVILSVTAILISRIIAVILQI